MYDSSLIYSIPLARRGFRGAWDAFFRKEPTVLTPTNITIKTANEVALIIGVQIEPTNKSEDGK